MKPEEKSPEMDAALKQIFGIDRPHSIMTKMCVFCGKPALDVDFRDEISRREFAISGICQSCQDQVFGGEDS